MNQGEVGADEFLSQLVRLAANERHLQHRDQEWRHPMGVNVRVSVATDSLLQVR